MPPLKNINHEKFARAVIEKPTITEAYRIAYDPENSRFKKETAKDIAKNSGSRLLSNASVKNRVTELLNIQGLTLERFNQKLGDLLEAKSEDVQFKSTRLGYELHGVLDRQGNNADSSRDILIQVNIMGSNGEQDSVTI